jgi:succinoglycan biosynthesis protein ExoO
MNPEVSVILPVYNSEQYITKAIRSLLKQTYQNFEVIIVDDGSTDSTAKIAANLADDRFRIIKKRRNQGVAAARNTALKMARGKWITLLDADDWYAPERLEKLLEIAQNNRADLIADNLFLIRDRARFPWSNLFTENQYFELLVGAIDTVTFIKTDQPAKNVCKRSWSLGYTKPLMRRQFLLDWGIEYDETLEVGEDFVFYLQCLIRGASLLLVSQPYYYYRNRTSSLSTRSWFDYLDQSCQLMRNLIETEELIRTNPALVMAMSENLVIFEKQLAYCIVVTLIRKRYLSQIFQSLWRKPFIIGYLMSKALDFVRQKFQGLIANNLPSAAISID